MSSDSTLLRHLSSPQVAEQIAEIRWSTASRLGFRLSFLFLLLSILVVYSPLGIIPLIGTPISAGVNAIVVHSAQWVGQHMFHLSGIAAEDHPTDSRDTALNWIALGLTLCLSLLGTLVWTLVDWRRPHYQTAAAWLRFLLRMSLVFLMLRYGLGKVFPL